jgi:hypothetical protein
MDTPLLLSELNAHTTWSDGTLSLPALVDLYGGHGFDVLCVTDHVCRDGEGNRRSVGIHNWRAYLDEIEIEAARAWRAYRLLVIPGVELTYDDVDPFRSAHALAIGLRRFVRVDGGIPRAVRDARGAGAAIVAAHPHAPSANRRGTCRWWLERLEPSVRPDRYELFNGDDVFGWVSEGGLPCVATGGFHRPEHVQTWKTLLPCQASEQAVVSCLRSSRRLYLTPFPQPWRPVVERLAA